MNSVMASTNSPGASTIGLCPTPGMMVGVSPMIEAPGEFVNAITEFIAPGAVN